MENVMVCVTQQKTCERLIKYGHSITNTGSGSEFFIIHVAHYEFKFLGTSRESEALEYLYQKALEYNANLTVIRSGNVLETLVDFVMKNRISKIVLGASGEMKNENNLVNQLRERLAEKAEILVIPAD